MVLDMALTPKAAFDFDGLAEVLLVEARDAFALYREEHPKHHFYCMALYTAGDLGYIMPTAMSEEGLAEAVASYRKKPRYAKVPVAKLSEQLRWSPCDSPHHDEIDFTTVGTHMTALAAALNAIDVITERARFDAFVDRAHETVFQVLSALDAEHCFGKGRARERIFVSMLMGDQDRSVLTLGERLNPRTTYERYRDAVFST